MEEQRVAEGSVAGLLNVEALSVRYESPRQPAVEAVRSVDLTVRAGEAVGILGESGSGKSTLAVALANLLPPNATLEAGRLSFDGHDLLALDEESLDRLRGDRLSVIFQQPGLALNPLRKVGAQIGDVLRAHRQVSTSTAQARTLELLAEVLFDEPESVAAAYPHQLSGGQQQRVAIAQALICEPELLIADEPTAALDSVTQANLVELFERLSSKLDMALVFVSHDPALLARVADRLVVMYAGRVVEAGPAATLLDSPRHPYPAELMRCVRQVEDGGAPLYSIPGAPPRLDPPPYGCAFEPRCPRRLERCATEAPLESAHGGGSSWCWNDLEAGE
jgi:oligopeptide/dipeptide ABC transporter ATP-binding protein